MTLSISGTVYTDQGVTPMGAGRTVKLSIAGAAADAHTATTASDGTFTISGVTATVSGVNANLLLYLQGNPENACASINTIYSSTSPTLTGCDLFQDYLCVRAKSGTNASATNPTGTTLNVSDNNGDTGITAIYSSASNTDLTMAAGKSLYMASGLTFPTSVVTLSVGGHCINDGTWNGTSSITLTLAGTGNFNFKAGTGSAPNVTINGSGGTYTLTGAMVGASNANITIGANATLDASASNFGVTCSGNWSNSGIFTPRAGTVTFRTPSATKTLDPGSSSFNNVVVTGLGASGTLQLTNNNLSVSGTFTQDNSGGNNTTFDSNSLNVTVTGLATLAGSTSAALYLYKTGTHTFNGGLTISGGLLGGSSGGVGSAGSIVITGALTISGTASMAAPTSSGSMSVSGNLTTTSSASNNGFNKSTSTLTLNGTGNQTITGSFTFYNRVATCTTARSIIFTDGTTTTVTNADTMHGAAGQLLTLTGTGAAGYTQALPATQTYSYLDVSYCTATGNALLAGTGSQSTNGNNVNVVFIPAASFTMTPLTGSAPLSSTGTDASSNTPTSWLWEKNDGSGYVNFSGTPTAQNPTESFAAGTWSVRMTATNAAGSNAQTRTNYITATAASGPPAGGMCLLGAGS